MLSVLLGGVVASFLASRYQRKQQIFELRVEGVKTLLESHSSFLHAHLTAQEKDSHACWMRLESSIRYLRVLFPGKDAVAAFEAYFHAASEVSKHFGMKITGAAMEMEHDSLTRLYRSLNDLTRILVSRLGIPSNGGE